MSYISFTNSNLKCPLVRLNIADQTEDHRSLLSSLEDNLAELKALKALLIMLDYISLVWSTDRNVINTQLT